MPDRARVVVIGGGIIGTSVAYHLTEAGLDRSRPARTGPPLGRHDLARGRPGRPVARDRERHPAGAVLGRSSTPNSKHETGLATGFKRCGGVTVARTRDRMVQLQRTAATAEAYDLDCELISPSGPASCTRSSRPHDLVGAIWLPGDGTANPTDVTQSLARGRPQPGRRDHRRARGSSAINHARRRRHRRAAPTAGDIEAEVVVNCAGQWAKAVGALAGVNVPLHSAEHFYVVTEQIEGVHRDLPILRDPDGYTYFKEEVGGLVVGGFEPEAKPWVAPDQLPYPFEFQLLDEDWDHFSILMESALLRIPALNHTGIKKFYNGPESFTPDNQFILGEAPELQNFFVGAGFNSVGIASAGGAGRALAEWIVNGEPTSDLVAGRHPPLRAVQRQQPVAARPGRARSSGCTTRCRGRIAN